MNTERPLVDRNVAEDVDIPQAGRPSQDPTFLTAEQVEMCFKVTEGTRMHALLRVGFLLGLRPGEIRALKWDNIQFDKGPNGFLYVQAWARKTRDGRTKTDLSYRGLPMPRPVHAALLAHREHWGDNARSRTAMTSGEARGTPLRAIPPPPRPACQPRAATPARAETNGLARGTDLT
jgi:hypothetical protein